MKRFVIALIMSLLVLPLAARADGPEDQYVSIYSLLQVGDTLAEKGQTSAALARYGEAQTALTRLQTTYPSWNVNLVNYRLKYIAAKISELSQAQAPAPAAPAPVPPKPPTEVAPATPPVSGNVAVPGDATVKIVPPPAVPDTSNQIRELQEQIQHIQQDKALVEAKLKEALAARPAAVDPVEFAKAQDQIKGLQKENELLKTSLADAKTTLAPLSSSRQEKLQQSLSEANRKVAQLTEANAALASEKLALETQVKTTVVPDATTAALRDENVLLKKELADLKTRQTSASPKDALNLRLKEAEAQVAALQSDKQILRLEKIALQTRIKQLSTPTVVVSTNPVPAPILTSPTATDNIPMATNNAPIVVAPVAPIVAPAIVPAVSPVPAATNNAAADTNGAPILDSVTASRIAQLEAQRDELQKSLSAATHDIAGRKKGKELAAHIDEMTRQLAALRARMQVFESRQISYTPEELAILGKPDAVALMATAHSTGRKEPRELPASASMLVAEAQRYYTAHEFDKAEQKYLEILKLDPKNVTTLADLASIEIDAGRVPDAEKNLKAALVIDPNDDHCLYILGRLRYQQMKFDEAFDYLSRAAESNPQNSKIQNILGLTLSERGQRGPAETAFRKAIQLEPGFADAHLNLAVVYATQQPPLLELARWHYQKALATGHLPNHKLEALLEPGAATH